MEESTSVIALSVTTPSRVSVTRFAPMLDTSNHYLTNADKGRNIRKVGLWALLTLLLTGSAVAAPTFQLPPPQISTNPSIRLPDLVVTDFNPGTAREPKRNEPQEIPVRVVIKNQGDATAGKFRVSARFVTSQGDFMRPFKVVGQNSTWRPLTMAAMFPGETVVLEGTLLGSPFESGKTVDFYIKADSCDSDEFMPDYCRVSEFDETNNDSDVIPIFLP